MEHQKITERERLKQYRINNPEKRRQSQKKYKLKKFTDYGQRARLMYDQAKVRARVRNLEFDLEHSDIVIPKICPVLGINLDITQDGKRDNKPTLDRIDNTKGYTKNNIMIISGRANRIKSDASYDELINIAQYMSKAYL